LEGISLMDASVGLSPCNSSFGSSMTSRNSGFGASTSHLPHMKPVISLMMLLRARLRSSLADFKLSSGGDFLIVKLLSQPISKHRCHNASTLLGVARGCMLLVVLRDDKAEIMERATLGIPSAVICPRGRASEIRYRVQSHYMVV
jgi:hypothetical protein